MHVKVIKKDKYGFVWYSRLKIIVMVKLIVLNVKTIVLLFYQHRQNKNSCNKFWFIKIVKSATALVLGNK